MKAPRLFNEITDMTVNMKNWFSRLATRGNDKVLHGAPFHLHGSFLNKTAEKPIQTTFLESHAFIVLLKQL